MDDLVEALMVSPVGAALLMHLEMRQRTDRWWGTRWADDVNELAVAAAAAALDRVDAGPLLAEAVLVGERRVGPWAVDAPLQAASALRDARHRRPIAEALAGRLADVRSDGRLEWWWSDTPLTSENRERAAPLGSSRRPCSAWVTATWDGLWTVTEPDPALADSLIGAWEVYPGPVTRWSVEVADDARVYQIDGPSDWERLVRAHPLARERRPNSSWEIPGANQHLEPTHPLLRVEGQRAAVTRMARFVEPDWNSVAAGWDGVHLSWVGYLTTEGTAIDLGDGDVTMLRNWCSERTLWLTPVLGDPKPLPAPDLTGVASNVYGADPRDLPGRVEQDLEWLEHRGVA